MKAARRTLLLASALFVLLAAAAPARADVHIGAGLALGEPMWATVKFWFGELHGLDFRLGYDITDHGFAVGLDYQFDIPVWEERWGRIPFYLGVGFKTVLSGGPKGTGQDDAVRAGMRFPLGVAFYIDGPSLVAFVEAAPGFRFYPFTRADFDACAGVRYIFF